MASSALCKSRRVVMALLTRIPALVWAGAGLLGWIAGEVMATDPAVQPALHAFFNGPVGVGLDGLLKPLGIATQKIGPEDARVNGYVRAHFTEAFGRYHAPGRLAAVLAGIPATVTGP